MRFKDFVPGGFFGETFTSRESAIFHRAFNPKIVAKTVVDEATKKSVVRQHKIPYMADRRWVESVIELFAEQVGVTMPQAIQAIKTNSPEALQRALIKSAEIAEARGEKLSEDDVRVKARAARPVDFANGVRAAWGRALGLRHHEDKRSRDERA